MPTCFRYVNGGLLNFSLDGSYIEWVCLICRRFLGDAAPARFSFFFFNRWTSIRAGNSKRVRNVRIACIFISKLEDSAENWSKWWIAKAKKAWPQSRGCNEYLFSIYIYFCIDTRVMRYCAMCVCLDNPIFIYELHLCRPAVMNLAQIFRIQKTRI